MLLHLTDYSHEIHKFSWSSTMVWNFINPRICGLEEEPPPSHVLMTLQCRTSGRWLSHKDTDWMHDYQERGWVITRASMLSKTVWPFFMNPSPHLVCPALSSLAQGFTSKSGFHEGVPPLDLPAFGTLGEKNFPYRLRYSFIAAE